MKTMKHMVAFDCGNSSYRVVLGSYDGERLTMDVVCQVPNQNDRGATGSSTGISWPFSRI